MLPSHIKISACGMSCAGNATTSEKLQRNYSEYSFNFSIGKKFAGTPCTQVAIFPLDGNAIISENYNAIASEKLPV